MPLVQGRPPIANDFEDISLFDPKDIKRWRAQRDSQSSQDSTSSDGQYDDTHASMQSLGSNVSTPTLASDTSSLRSSICSLSSPALNSNVFNPSGGSPQNTTFTQNNKHSQIKTSAQPTSTTAAAPPAQHHAEAATQAAKVYGRRRSVPALIDNTSMASLIIKSQNSTRSRKQREMEFDADQDDDIWPGDGLMFNVPMSPALYNQQRSKQQYHHHPQTTVKPHNPASQHTAKHRHPHPHKSASYQPQVSSSLSQQHHGTQPNLMSYSTPQLRHSLPSIHEGNDGHYSSSASRYDENSSTNEDAGMYADNASANSSASTLPAVSPAMVPRSYIGFEQGARRSSASSLPSLMSRRGSYASDVASRIEGMDAEASNLTLQFSRLEETQDSQMRNTSLDGSSMNNHVSIASLSMLKDDGSLPSPSISSVRASTEESDSGYDSRRSSLTRPENLPPKSAEEEKKHMKEYEKLLKDAAAAEKRKQKKREEYEKQRAYQIKQDYGTWSTWLSKGGKYRLSSDIKWRGIPEKVRGSSWRHLNLLDQQQAVALPQPNTAYRAAIIKDSAELWPECCIFGQGRPLHDSLIYVVERFLSLRPEIHYSFSLIGIAALMLLYVSENDSVLIMYKITEPDTLLHAVLSGNERVASANYVSFGKVFRKTFERLSEHFAKVGLDDTDLLNPMVASLFTTVLPTPEAAARVFDVFLFDGDSFLLRAALGILRVNEAWLYGSRDEILKHLQNSRPVDDDDLMKSIRSITRS